MRSVLLGVFFCLVIHGLSAQNIQRTGYTNGGGTSSLTNSHVSYSYGQAVCQTVQNGEHSFTQGFQQPNFQTSVATVNPSWDGSMTTFPNPSMDKFSVEIKSLDATQGMVQIKNSLNQLVAKQDLMAEHHHLLTFDANRFKSGVYYIHLMTTSGEVLFTQKMIIQL